MKLFFVLWAAIPIIAIIDSYLFGFNSIHNYFLLTFVEISLFSMGFIAGKSQKT